MARIKRPQKQLLYPHQHQQQQQQQQRPFMVRLLRALLILCCLISLALLLRQADVFTRSTTAKHRNRPKKTAPDPNILIAEQQQQQQRRNLLRRRPPPSNLDTVVVASSAASSSTGEDSTKRRSQRIALDLKLLKGDVSSGTLVIELMEEWAPIGVHHFEKLIEAAFYNQVRFFRVVPNFVAQFGISGDPETQQLWERDILVDDPVRNPNERGTITYATSGPNTRTTQLFINLQDNLGLDRLGFAPFARIVSGTDLIDQIQDKYGETPDQDEIQQRGNEYLKENFPDLSFIAETRIL